MRIVHDTQQCLHDLNLSALKIALTFYYIFYYTYNKIKIELEIDQTKYNFNYITFGECIILIKSRLI